MQVISSHKIITNTKSTRFLGLIIDSSLSWKDHISELTSKLNKACYAIRAIKPFMSLDVIKIIHILMFTQLYHIVLFFGVILILVAAFLKSKKE
jgi:hypothetical protein